MGDNGRSPGGRRSYKKDQKNVSVYLGKATGWEAKALEAICSVTGWRESQLFRNLFFDYLTKQGLWDDKKGEPIEVAIQRLQAKATGRRLPSMLDLEGDDDEGD